MDSKIIRHKILAVFIHEGKEMLGFLMESGAIFAYKTQEDCCNSVWFEHIDNVEALTGATVLEVDVADYKDWNVIHGGEDEVLESAFWTIKTDKGHCKIEVRNSHNGYYGGDVVFVEEIKNLLDFKLLSEDF